VSLDDRHWEALALDAVDVEALQRFLEGYVETLDEPLPDVAWLLDRQRLGPPLADGLIPYEDADGWFGGGWGGGPAAPPGGPGGPGGPSEPAFERWGWQRAGAAADALRGAACAALMTGRTDEGIRLLLAAAGLYLRMGVPYGCFVGVAAFPDRELAELAARLLERTSGQEQALAGAEERFDAALQVPVQRLYLLLAVAGHPELRAASMRALASASHLIGPAPLGSSAAPLVEWWWIARLLGRLTEDRDEARAILVGVLAEFARRHGRQLTIAQVDRHHWRRIVAPVDLVDLDLAAVTCFAARGVAALRLEPLTLAEFAVEPLAEISLAVGLQLAIGGPESTATPWRRPWTGPSPTGRTPVKPSPEVPAEQAAGAG
jgi:hypothetical protein